MTRIDFYFNVKNKPQVVVNLVEAAVAKRRQVLVFAADEKMASEVSANLWQNKAESFLPNVQANHLYASVTPVVIGSQGSQFALDTIKDELLINLTSNQPTFFSRFTHLVELVGDDEQDKISARARFKFYRDRGYEIKSIDYAQVTIDKL